MPSRKRKLVEMTLVPSADHVSTSQKILQEVEHLRSALTLDKPEGLLKQLSQIDAMFDKVQNTKELDEAVKEKILGSLLILKQNYADRAREHEGTPPDLKEDPPLKEEEGEEEEEEDTDPSNWTDVSSTKDATATPLLESAQKYKEAKDRGATPKELMELLREEREVLRNIGSWYSGGHPSRYMHFTSTPGPSTSKTTDVTPKTTRTRRPPKVYTPSGSQWIPLSFKGHKTKKITTLLK